MKKFSRRPPKVKSTQQHACCLLMSDGHGRSPALSEGAEPRLSATRGGPEDRDGLRSYSTASPSVLLKRVRTI
jgi:hypothetical protein